jgi:hypothetical protein
MHAYILIRKLTMAMVCKPDVGEYVGAVDGECVVGTTDGPDGE